MTGGTIGGVAGGFFRLEGPDLFFDTFQLLENLVVLDRVVRGLVFRRDRRTLGLGRVGSRGGGGSGSGSRGGGFLSDELEVFGVFQRVEFVRENSLLFREILGFFLGFGEPFLEELHVSGSGRGLFALKSTKFLVPIFHFVMKVLQLLGDVSAGLVPLVEV
jgi:hypothetical protein